MPSDSDPVQAELQSAYQEYRSAMSAWRSAVKAGSSTGTDATMERMLRARVALYRALLATGWSAPAPVAHQLERDAALLEAPNHFDALVG